MAYAGAAVEKALDPYGEVSTGTSIIALKYNGGVAEAFSGLLYEIWPTKVFLCLPSGSVILRIFRVPSPTEWSGVLPFCKVEQRVFRLIGQAFFTLKIENHF